MAVDQSPSLTQLSTATVPPTKQALWLGYMSLVPFLIGTLLIALLHPQTHAEAHFFVLEALAKYAALVISFLAGIQWGVAISQGAPLVGRHLTGSLVITLIAWLSSLMPPQASLVIAGLLLTIGYVLDRKYYPQWHMSSWLTLRFRLSVISALSCFLAASWSPV